MANQDIWVFSEKSGLLNELIPGALNLANQTQGNPVAIILGPKTEVDKATGLGAKKIYWLGELKPGYMVEDYVPTLAELIKENQPAALFIGATKRGKAVAGRLAARLGLTTITDVKQFMVQNGALQATHMIYGGGAVRVEQKKTPSLLATVGLGIFEGKSPDSGNADVIEVKFAEPEKRIILKEKKDKGTSSVNLAAAKKVICPGRGIQKEEDLGMIKELAQTLEGEIGCTRPLSEGLDWLPRERYIGVSGAFVKPDLYIGIGVSGQVQHTVGITESRVVVGINKDENAPIFSQADYGIVGDLYAVVPALIKALQARK